MFFFIKVTIWGTLYQQSHWCKRLNIASVEILIILLDFSLTVKAATLIFISGCGSASPSAKEGKSGFIYNLVKS